MSAENSARGPVGNPQSRGGRLFAVPILEHGTFSALRGAAAPMLQWSAEERAQMVRQLVEQTPSNLGEADARRTMLTALSEIEAHELISRIRHGRRR
jgi:hypothetical protein